MRRNKQGFVCSMDTERSQPLERKDIGEDPPPDFRPDLTGKPRLRALAWHLHCREHPPENVETQHG